MPPVRIGRGWTDDELRAQLAALAALRPSTGAVPLAAMRPEDGWRAERVTAVVGREPAGPPVHDGAFARAAVAVANYEMSDPTIVQAHFDARRPLLGRRMLLEIKVLGVHALCGAVVTDVAPPSAPGTSTAGFRYDTLDGHLERGAEWFVVEKVHATGEVRLRIESRWQRGDLPAWWIELGFAALAPTYRTLWLRRVVARVRVLAREPVARLVRHRALVHEGPGPGALAPARAPADHPTRVAAGLAAVSGARSLAGLALLAGDAALEGPRAGASRAERLLAHPSVAAALAGLAGAEMIADKLPFVGSRLAPWPLAARVVMGAAASAAAATRAGTPRARAVLIGAVAAASGALASYGLRAVLTRALGNRPAVAGVVEDAVAAVAGLVVLRAR